MITFKEIIISIIGLIGVVLGVFSTLASTWFTNKHQRRLEFKKDLQESYKKLYDLFEIYESLYKKACEILAISEVIAQKPALKKHLPDESFYKIFSKYHEIYNMIPSYEKSLLALCNVIFPEKTAEAIFNTVKKYRIEKDQNINKIVLTIEKHFLDSKIDLKGIELPAFEGVPFEFFESRAKMQNAFEIAEKNRADIDKELEKIFSIAKETLL
jgi:hypothetical protein